MGLPAERALAKDPELVHMMNGTSTSKGHPEGILEALPDDGQTGCARNLNRVTRSRPLLLLLGAVLLIVIISFAVYYIGAVLKTNQCLEQKTLNEGVDYGAALPPCGDDWIWHRNKCYYFSEDKGNWTVAKDSCAALDSSLPVIDSRHELDFLQHHKGDHECWIGLTRRDPDQPWIWVNGTKFTNWFTVNDYSECAYLNYDKVKSTECYSKRHWICTKMSVYEKKRKKRSLIRQHFY